MTAPDPIAELARRQTPGGPEWCVELAAHIHQRVVREFRDQIPAGLRPTFSLEDLAQETSLRLVDHFHHTRRYETLTGGLVVVVARRVMIDHIRRHLAKKRLPAGGFVAPSRGSSACLLDAVAQPQPSPSQPEMNSEFWQLVMSYLDAPERELIELKYNEDLNDVQIANVLGRSPHAIRSLLYRVRRKVREALRQHPEYESQLGS